MRVPQRTRYANEIRIEEGLFEICVIFGVALQKYRVLNDAVLISERRIFFKALGPFSSKLFALKRSRAALG